MNDSFLTDADDLYLSTFGLAARAATIRAFKSGTDADAAILQTCKLVWQAAMSDEIDLTDTGEAVAADVVIGVLAGARCAGGDVETSVYDAVFGVIRAAPHNRLDISRVAAAAIQAGVELVEPDQASQTLIRHLATAAALKAAEYFDGQTATTLRRQIRTLAGIDQEN